MIPFIFKPIDIYAHDPAQNSIWRDSVKIERALLHAQGKGQYMTHRVAKQWRQDATAEAEALARIAGPNAHAEKLKQLATHCERLTRSQEELKIPACVQIAFMIAASVVACMYRGVHLGLPVFGLIFSSCMVKEAWDNRNKKEAAATVVVVWSELNAVKPSEKLFYVESPSTTHAFCPYWTSEAAIERQHQWQTFSANLMAKLQQQDTKQDALPTYG